METLFTSIGSEQLWDHKIDNLNNTPEKRKLNEEASQSTKSVTF